MVVPLASVAADIHHNQIANNQIRITKMVAA
jgi:hypothetical protein